MLAGLAVFAYLVHSAESSYRTRCGCSRSVATFEPGAEKARPADFDVVEGVVVVSEGESEIDSPRSLSDYSPNTLEPDFFRVRK